jgi:arylsulfatase A-like enzyme
MMSCRSVLRLSLAIGALFLGHPAEGQQKVLLIGIDGVRPDVLADVATPNLDRLISEGAFSDQVRTTRPTSSGPAWSSMLTGVWPEKHAVLSNNFQGNEYATYPDFLSRIEQLRPDLVTFAAVDWLPLVTEVCGGPLITGVLDSLVVRNGYMGWSEADAFITQAAVDVLEGSDPDAMFVYLGAPDEMSHQAGSIGEEYRTAIAFSDHHVGQLLDAIRARVSYAEEDWLILVSTDHGRRADGGHGGDSPEELTIFFFAHGPSVIPGEILGTPAIVDVAVTALTHLGIQINPDWGLDGRDRALQP